MICFFFFFFQAEDGIRDLTVTGVQTCALPIWRVQRVFPPFGVQRDPEGARRRGSRSDGVRRYRRREAQAREHGSRDAHPIRERSEERRVGKECRSRWWP